VPQTRLWKPSAGGRPSRRRAGGDRPGAAWGKVIADFPGLAAGTGARGITAACGPWALGAHRGTPRCAHWRLWRLVRFSGEYRAEEQSITPARYAAGNSW